VKTPNLDCLEADLFGPFYHSLKREHLVYPTARSLATLGRRAGLETMHLGSTSHLLAGFLGSDRIAKLIRDDRGADLVAHFRRH
jgi:hypothetical protein